MKRSTLAFFFGGVAVLLFMASFALVAAYAGPEPFFEYRREHAIAFIGGTCAAIVLWSEWSLGLIGAVFFRALRVWALLGLLVATISVFYLQQGLMGYLEDLERMVLPPK
jgi:hypothetical protein